MWNVWISRIKTKLTNLSIWITFCDQFFVVVVVVDNTFFGGILTLFQISIICYQNRKTRKKCFVFFCIQMWKAYYRELGFLSQVGYLLLESLPHRQSLITRFRQFPGRYRWLPFRIFLRVCEADLKSSNLVWLLVLLPSFFCLVSKKQMQMNPNVSAYSSFVGWGSNKHPGMENQKKKNWSLNFDSNVHDDDDIKCMIKKGNDFVNEWWNSHVQFF